MKYLAIAAVVSLTSLGVVGTAFARADLSAGRESRAAGSHAKAIHQPTRHVARKAIRGPLYLYGWNLSALRQAVPATGGGSVGYNENLRIDRW